MRLPQDREFKVIVDGCAAVGFVGSIVSTGKELAMTRLERGPQTVLIATPALLRDTIFDEGRASKETIDTLNALSGSATRQRGGWSLLGTIGGRLVGGRDIIGQRPLFWGRNDEFHVFASSRKALWSLGIFTASCIPEGTILEFGMGRSRECRIGELTRPSPQPFEEKQTVAELLKLLYASVRAMTQGFKRVGILFSGGLDSSIVAAIANSLGLETRLYTAAFEDSPDIASAEKAADLLGLGLEVEVVSFDEVEDVLRRTIWEMESPDSIQVCVGMAIEVAARTAVGEGESLLLSGCGADELFGGYSKYLQGYRMFGEERVGEMMFRAVRGLGSRDLLRDGAIGEANRVQLSAPFLDLELVRFGLEIPVNLKFYGIDDGLRKRVLRRAAQVVGVPQEMVDRPKKAAQYSSKSLATVKKLAGREGLSLQGYLESIFNEVFASYFKTSSRP